RRLLENGANSSFVSAAADSAVPIAAILERPQQRLGDARRARHSAIPLPRDLYGSQRRNSAGVEFGDRAGFATLLAEVDRAGATEGGARAAPVVDGVVRAGATRTVRSPIDGAAIGDVAEADETTAGAAMATAAVGFPAWAGTPLARRAAVIERAGDLIEARRA